MRTFVKFGCLAVLAFMCGCANHQQKNKQQALERWQKVQRDMTVEQAEQRFRAGDYNLALQEVQDLLKRYPDYVPAYSLAGRIYLEEGNFKQSLDAFNTCLKLDEHYDLAHYHIAVVYEKWNRLEDALTHYQAAMQERPRHTAYQVAVAETLVGMGRYDEAMAMLKDMLKTYGPDVALLDLVGGIYQYRQEYAKAESCYREALQLDESNKEVMFALAQNLQTQEKYQEALKLFESIHAVQEEGAPANRHWDFVEAECFLMVGQWHRAIRLLEEITKEQPDHVMAWARLAQGWLARGQYQQAEQAARMALALKADQPDALSVTGYVALMQKDWAKGLDAYQRILTQDAANSHAMSMIGYIYACLGEKEQAEACLRKAMEMNPENRFALSLQEQIGRP